MKVGLKNGYYKSASGNENVDWFVDEVIKLEHKMNFYSKNTKKDIIMTQEDEADVKNNNICRFCEKKNYFWKSKGSLSFNRFLKKSCS